MIEFLAHPIYPAAGLAESGKQDQLKIITHIIFQKLKLQFLLYVQHKYICWDYILSFVKNFSTYYTTVFENQRKFWGKWDQ